MEKIVVFDFDKTLINYDSIYPFFKFCAKQKRFKQFLLPVYFILKILSKGKIISVKKEKEIALFLYCPKEYQEFKNVCKHFASTIQLNNIYYKHFINYKDSKIIIASASFEVYLKSIFPKNIVIGTQLNTNNNKIIGIKSHPYKKEKKELLEDKGIYLIDIFYTDSKNDQPLADISKKTYWVKHGKVKNIE